MKKRVCCIFNLAPHYRSPIFRLMDQELGCDFYFGDTLGNQIELMNHESLKGFKKILKNKRLTKSGFMWQTGVWQLIFKPYKHYIITGSPSLLSSWVLVIMAIIFNKKVYAWTHGIKKPGNKKGQIFKKTFYKLCYKILLYGNFSREVMIKEGFKKNKLVPIYNSLDYQKQILVRETLKKTNIFSSHFKNSHPVVIYIGRLQKSKRLDLLVLALKDLKAKNIECNLVLVGSDIENGEISTLVYEKEMQENTWFYGPCYNESEIGELLYNSDVCVSPGPVGLTALHAMTFGCPVISNDDFENQMPEFEVIIPGKTGEFFSNGNLISLSDTINKWLNLTIEKREKVRKSSYQVIDAKWNPQHQVEILKRQLNLNR